MIILQANDVSVSFGGETLFSDVSLRLDEQGRAGLVGVNGCGKTTLFNCILGKLTPDSGNISTAAGVKIGSMEQYVIRDDSVTLYDEVLEIFRPLINLEQEIADIGLQIDMGDHSEKTLTRQMQLQDKFQREGGLYFRSRVQSALIGLGFEKAYHDKPIKVLSGGQKSKAQLAKLLLSDSDILLLDEPTNHLDFAACEWLERFLSEYKGAYIVISHDRYFLDKVTGITYELENKHLREYKGNYTGYLKLKEQYMLTATREYEKTLKEINRIEGIVEQQRRWGVEHNFITAASKQKQADRLKETLVKPESSPDSIKFNFKCKEGGGNDVLTVKGLSKSFDGREIFRDVSFEVKKGNRVFIMGENGCGKTTLLKILVGLYTADKGSVRFGSEIAYGYYDQAQSDLSPEKTAMDEIWDIYPSLTHTEIRNSLAAFLFKGEEVFKQIGDLSGGEKARISLLKLMLKGCNLLLLDEPTNHLDIRSREALENALMSFGGTIVAVSHDRYLINKLADRIVLMNDSGMEEIYGNYDTCLEVLEARREQKASEAQPKERKTDYKDRKEQQSNLRKMRARVNLLEKEISEAEKKIDEIAACLQSPDSVDDYVKLGELSEEMERLKVENEERVTEWMELSEQLESVT